MDEKLRSLARHSNLCTVSPEVLIQCLEDYRFWLEHLVKAADVVGDVFGARVFKYQDQLFKLLEALDGRGA